MENMNTTSPLWLAVYNAYESHNVAEARRLLKADEQPPACSDIMRCSDIDYVRWLLSNDLIPPTIDSRSTWPELEELQLQCNALSEAARPACILKGELPTAEHEK